MLHVATILLRTHWNSFHNYEFLILWLLWHWNLKGKCSVILKNSSVYKNLKKIGWKKLVITLRSLARAGYGVCSWRKFRVLVVLPCIQCKAVKSTNPNHFVTLSHLTKSLCYIVTFEYHIILIYILTIEHDNVVAQNDDELLRGMENIIVWNIRTFLPSSPSSRIPSPNVAAK